MLQARSPPTPVPVISIDQDDVAPEAELPPVLRLTDASGDLKEMSEAGTTTQDSHSALGQRRPLLSQMAILEEDELDEETAMGLRSALTFSPTEAQQHAIDANPAENRLAVRVSLRVGDEDAVRIRGTLFSLKGEGWKTENAPPFSSLTLLSLITNRSGSLSNDQVCNTCSSAMCSTARKLARRIWCVERQEVASSRSDSFFQA